nr:sensor domain-containing diguanylate cyclase [Nocardia bovistercoris]
MLAAAIGRGHGIEPLRASLSKPRRSLADRAAVARDEELFHMVFDNVAVAIGIADIEGTLVEVNGCLADSVGRSVEDVRGMSIFDFAHPEEVAGIRRLVSERLVAERQGTVRTESRVQHADGHFSWLACSITYVRGKNGDADFLLAVGQDITKRHRLQEELHWQARHDVLTGLPNRRYLLERIDRLCLDAATTDRVGLCYVDIDEFKAINDRYGHGVGDRVLSAVATRLRECCAADEYLIARLGGDEFVVLVTRADDRRIAAVADTVLTGFTRPIVVDRRKIPVSASIGAVVAAIWGTRSETLLDAADRELYRAKRDGKDRWALCVLDGKSLSVEPTR